jgi:hypothetical protein
MSMTEASGLETDESRIRKASDAIRAMANEAPLTPSSEPHGPRLTERLRQLTLEAPLQSLAIAFLLGVLLARRR